MVAHRKQNGSAITSQNYFAELGSLGVARSTLSEARAKLDWRCFQYLLAELNHSASEPLWKGHRVYAADGCHLSLPASEAVLKEYPRAKSKAKRTHYPKMMMVAATNVLSGLPYTARFAAGESGSERGLLVSMLDEFKRGDIILADRGFDGVQTLSEIERRGQYFIVRMKVGKTASLPVQQLLRSGQRSMLTELIDPSGRAVKVLLIRKGRDHKGLAIVVATNLIGRAYARKALFKLYLMRWRIETAYYRVKRLLNVEKFYARSLGGVYQEIWANLFVLGLTAYAIQQSLLATRSLKAPNFKNAVEVVRRTLHHVVSLRSTRKEANQMAERMIDEIRAVVCRKQPGRKNPRLSRQPINRWTMNRPLGKDRPKTKRERASAS